MINPFHFWKTGRDKPLLQDQSEIDRLYKKYRLSVMLAVTVGYGLAYPLRLALSALKKPLIDGNVFSATELGAIGSALLYSYAFGKFFNGFLADHANVKRFFATGVLLSSLMNLLIWQSNILWLWIIIWGLNGWF